MQNSEPTDQSEWQRLEAEYQTATPDRRAAIDQRLDEMEHEAGVEWLAKRQSPPA